MSHAPTNPHRDDAWKVLHGAGWTDRRIAAAFALSQATVSKWLRSAGLPANGAPFRKADVDYNSVLRLYREGLNDHAIAREVRVDPSHICKWRSARGLPAQFDGRQANRQTLRKARKMLRLGATKDQVAAEVSLHRRTVQKLRQTMSDPGLRRAGLNNRAIRDRLKRDPSILPRIEDAIGREVPSEVKHEAVMSLYIDVLDGRIAECFIEKQAARFRNKAWAMCGSPFGAQSLNEEIGEDGWTRLDTLEDPGALEAMEAAAEAAWNDND